ncbi:hypothetical protein UCRNP2_245 [Neofusicoccum parvum UCRNP2]|uniref:Mediator of RNA polymerase II transcription subunit 9 n=1 Tax=Botryosphaeria parva (strain UCR-NP2) TaxID=1287680 RepID=R1H3F0_BOTPV|nr:hypothetical protein UCRNP2_245 [Neofusicoccum parvum UCRNP2]
MAATGTPRLSTYSTPATPANRGLSVAPSAQNGSTVAAANASAASQAPPLPPPATFDVLPHLHTLLNRLLLQKPPDTQAAGGDDTTTTNTNKPPGDDGTTGGAGASSSSSARAAAGPPTDPDAAPLEIHQLTAASSALKVRMQKARQACARLGDMDRSVDEQQDELAELEDRVARLRNVLEDLGVGTGGADAPPGGDGGGNEMVLRAVRPI